MGAPIVIPRPDPLTVLVPAWCVFWGTVGAILFAAQPPATTTGIPAVAVYVLFAGLVASGSALLYGMWLRSVRGIRIKLGANGEIEKWLYE